MKRLLALAVELLAYIAVGLFAGRYADSAFGLKGWGTLACVFGVYFLWILQAFKFRSHNFEQKNFDQRKLARENPAQKDLSAKNSPPKDFPENQRGDSKE